MTKVDFRKLGEQKYPWANSQCQSIGGLRVQWVPECYVNKLCNFDTSKGAYTLSDYEGVLTNVETALEAIHLVKIAAMRGNIYLREHIDRYSKILRTEARALNDEDLKSLIHEGILREDMDKVVNEEVVIDPEEKEGESID